MCGADGALAGLRTMVRARFRSVSAECSVARSTGSTMRAAPRSSPRRSAEVDAQLLAAASLHDRVTLDAHLQLLLEERIMYAQHRRDRVFYSFRHALIRDAAYASMPPAVRCANHARVSQALAAQADRGADAHANGADEHATRLCI